MKQQLWQVHDYKFLFQWNRDDLLEIIESVILPDWTSLQSGEPDCTFELKATERSLSLIQNGETRVQGVKKETLQQTLKRESHINLATYAPNLVFVHAGVVLYRGGLIMIPGGSYTGKSTLTKSLVEAGGIFYSDEYAIVDSTGLVRPFPRPHCERLKGGKTKLIPAQRLGWRSDLGAAPVTSIIVTKYEKDAEWKPRKLTAGEAVLKMLENTVSAQAEPQRAIRYLSMVAKSAHCLASHRAESGPTAQNILTSLGRFEGPSS